VKAIAVAAIHPPREDRTAKAPSDGRLEERPPEEKKASPMRPEEQEEEPPTRPPEVRRPPASRPAESEVDRLVKRLKDKDTRKAAACALAMMGKKGRPAARALCECIVATRGDTREALLEALEKVHPRLHKHVLTLLVDKNSYNYTNASQAIAHLGEDGTAAVPILLAHARWAAEEEAGADGSFMLRSWNDNMLDMDIRALTQLAGTEPHVIKFISKMVTFPDSVTPHYRGHTVRPLAVAALQAIGKKEPKLRKGLVPTILRGLKVNFPGSTTRDTTTTLAAIRALGDFGSDAKAAVAALKKEKLNPDQQIREAAIAALAKIEKDDKDDD
jgi:HEAT repeat protein